jgi:hypothetical protein
MITHPTESKAVTAGDGEKSVHGGSGRGGLRSARNRAKDTFVRPSKTSKT